MVDLARCAEWLDRVSRSDLDPFGRGSDRPHRQDLANSLNGVVSPSSETTRPPGGDPRRPRWLCGPRRSLRVAWRRATRRRRADVDVVSPSHRPASAVPAVPAQSPPSAARVRTDARARRCRLAGDRQATTGQGPLLCCRSSSDGSLHRPIKQYFCRLQLNIQLPFFGYCEGHSFVI